MYSRIVQLSLVFHYIQRQIVTLKDIFQGFHGNYENLLMSRYLVSLGSSNCTKFFVGTTNSNA